MALSDRNKVYVKTFKAQVYYVEKVTDSSTLVSVLNRHFPYPKSVYDSGGLWCAARDLSASEATSYGATIGKRNINLRFSHNDDITADKKILFQGKVFEVYGQPDNYGLTTNDDTVVNCFEKADTNTYSGDVFDE